MKLIKKLFLSLAMLMTMSVSASAQASEETRVTDKGTLTVDGVTYQLYYKEYIIYYPNPANYHEVLQYILDGHGASVIDIPQGVEEITIPTSVTKDNEVYAVTHIACQMQSNGVEYYSSLYSTSLKVLRFNGYVSMATDDSSSNSKDARLHCPNLTDLYFNAGLPSMMYSYTKHFTAPSGTVTLHVKGYTKEQVTDLKTQAPWKEFKDILGGTASTSLTLFAGKSNDDIEVWGDGEKLASIPQEGGSIWNLDLTKEYIEFRIPSTYLEKIIINGEDVTTTLPATTPTEPAYQGYTFYTMYEFPEQMTVEVRCNAPQQTGAKLNFVRQGGSGQSWIYWNDQSQDFFFSAGSSCVTIPNEQLTDLQMHVQIEEGETFQVFKEGEYITNQFHKLANSNEYWAELEEESATYTLLIKKDAPETSPRHQPEIMVMRSGEGDILFKGLCLPEEQSAEAYEQQFGYPADEYGVVVSAVSNCTNTVTTVTVPDYDYLGRGEGYKFDATEWGFNAEITPVAGQRLKTLLVGYVGREDGRETIIWEDLLYGKNYGMHYPGNDNLSYVTYNESSNTYTLHWGFDEMNWWIGDYILNIAMGSDHDPTWNILQDEELTGTKVVVTRNGEDEETTLTSAFTTVNVGGQGVEKVRLKVPVGHVEQVTKYKVRLLTVTHETGAALYLTTKLGISRTKATLIINTIPQNLPKNFETEEEAQEFINGFASYGTAEIVPTTVDQAVSDNVSIKVVLNGEDITSQMNTSDPLYSTYEAQANSLIDAVWEISKDDNTSRYDVNRDGEVNIVDVTKLVNKILGKE